MGNHHELVPPKDDIWLADMPRLFGGVKLSPEFEVWESANQIEGWLEERMAVTQLGNPGVQVIGGKVFERAENIGRENVLEFLLRKQRFVEFPEKHCLKHYLIDRSESNVWLWHSARGNERPTTDYTIGDATTPFCATCRT
jgi:hypothetical protein